MLLELISVLNKRLLVLNLFHSFAMKKYKDHFQRKIQLQGYLCKLKEGLNNLQKSTGRGSVRYCCKTKSIRKSKKRVVTTT